MSAWRRRSWRALAGGSLSIALAAVAASSDAATHKPKAALKPQVDVVEMQERAYAKAQLLDHFKDPDSVKFKDVLAIPAASGQWTYCGKVNAKNSYGAYTGYRGFLVYGFQKGYAMETETSGPVYGCTPNFYVGSKSVEF